MNKNRVFTASFSSVERQVDGFYNKAALGAIHFDGQGRSAATDAALTLLDEAQAKCLDFIMQTVEVERACEYLAKRNDKVKPLLKRFWDGLVTEDQGVRFEVTSQALRVIRQQFGG